MEFNDEQNAHIATLIETALEKAREDTKNEIAGLNRKITDLNAEKKSAKDDADREAREKLEANGSVEDYKARLQAEEGTNSELRGKLKELNFNNAILGAVGGSAVRDDLRAVLTDSLMFRAKYDEASGHTTVDGLSPTEYLEKLFTSEQGKFYVRPSGSIGGGSTGGAGSGNATMDEKTFNLTTFSGLPEAERHAIAEKLGRPELKKI